MARPGSTPPDPAPPLRVGDHDRGSAGRTWVYAVLSRRAGGVSVGVNLNPNRACNWRCVYCQVPGLVRGAAPPTDLAALEAQLESLLIDVQEGDFLARRAPGARLADVSISGDGEATTAARFREAVDAIGRMLARRGLAGAVPLVLITNGSQVHRPRVRAGIERLAALGGEVWFKLDRATEAGMRAVNDARGAERQLRNLRLCARLCATRVQALFCARRGAPPEPAEIEAWLGALAALAREGVPLRGVQLYGLARPSRQPEAPELTPLPAAWLEALGRRVAALGFPVQVRP